MIRLTASPSDHGFIFPLAGDGALILTTGNRQEAADQKLSMDIEVSDQLLEAAEHWGVVEIREDANPEWRGGRARAGRAPSAPQRLADLECCGPCSRVFEDPGFGTPRNSRSDGHPTGRTPKTPP